ncbi:ribonuclease H-like domain-containing protein [Tanacetum coccineum]
MEINLLVLTKKKLECFKCHNTGHFARECLSKGINDGKKIDSFYQDQGAGKKVQNQNCLLTMDDGVVIWGEHTVEEEETNHALMAISSNNEGANQYGLMANRLKVNTVSSNVNTIRSRQPVPTRTSNSFSPKRPQGNWGTAVKTSAGYNWSNSRPNSNSDSGPTFIRTDHPLKNMKDRGIFDSRYSGHMTGNKDYLDDFEEYKGGSVTFGELGHFNLFSISQICDKQHKVLFTETKCLIVSPDFKMPDENHILLKVPRQHNMYSFDMKTPSLTKDYACLIAKATSDESKLWHRRFSWVFFLATKDETSGILQNFIRQIENQLNHRVRYNPPKANAYEEADEGCRSLIVVLQQSSHSRKQKIMHRASQSLTSLRMGFFDEASYDEEGMVHDFNNLPTEVAVSPIPTLRIHNIHPQSQILGDPKSSVQTRSRVKQTSGAHAHINKRRICFLKPPGFVDSLNHPKKVYKVVKTLYGLHQAPKDWYATLSTFLEEHGYRKGTIDKTLFIKKDKKDIMLVQVYVDDIIL